ncbi:MAG TPA: hypothetical protein DHV39_11205 [Verrucomicrobiales bacterium]|nr:hypothetical protein [Verrucomicrobiales bacterium]HCP37812.1 hypothetical protein [Verrucomicrobiales bacterium]HCZ03962.1 hypothetical protein [Verrucomicrobiales bacterium]
MHLDLPPRRDLEACDQLTGGSGVDLCIPHLKARNTGCTQENRVDDILVRFELAQSETSLPLMKRMLQQDRSPALFNGFEKSCGCD